MKKITALILSLALILGLPACSSRSADSAYTGYRVYDAGEKTDIDVPGVMSSCMYGDTLYILSGSGVTACNTEDGSARLLASAPEGAETISADPKNGTLWLSGEELLCSIEPESGAVSPAEGGPQGAKLLDAAAYDGAVFAITKKEVYFGVDGEFSAADAPKDFKAGSLVTASDGRVLLQAEGSGSANYDPVYLLSKDGGIQEVTALRNSDGDPVNTNLLLDGSGSRFDCFMASVMGSSGTPTVEDGTIIYGVDIDEGTVEPIFDTAGLGCTGVISGVYAEKEGYTLLISGEEGCYTMSFTPTEQEKVLLTAAYVGGISGDSAEVIKSFNRSSREYYIAAKNYYGDDAERRFALDIANGKFPDIVNTTFTAFESYARKGFFTDMYTMMDGDGDISRGDLVQSVTGALESSGGLYQIAPYYYLDLVYARSDILDGRGTLTFSELLELAGEYPDTAIMGDMNYWTLMEALLTYNLDRFMDYDSMTCSFDSQEFADFLQFIKTASETQYEDYSEVMLIPENFKTFRQYKELSMLSLYAENREITGFPTDSGSGIYAKSPARYGICAQSEHQDGAWAFIKFMLSPEYQDAITDYLPILRSSLEKQADAAGEGFPGETSVELITDPLKVASGAAAAEYATVTTEPLEGLDESEISGLLELIDAVDTFDTDDGNTLMNVIWDECKAFFAGDKTAEEVGSVLNGRIKLFMNE